MLIKIILLILIDLIIIIRYLKVYFNRIIRYLNGVKVIMFKIV